MKVAPLVILACILTVVNSQIGGLTFAQAALAGAGGLGAAIAGGAALGGVAAAATNAIFRRGGGNNNRGGRSYYRSYNRRSRYRGRRQAESITIEELAEMDEYDCGKQYLCELTAIQANQFNIQDPLILQLLQSKYAVPKEAEEFKDAVDFGFSVKDPNLCIPRYKSCASGKQTMVSIVQFLRGLQEDVDTHPNSA